MSSFKRFSTIMKHDKIGVGRMEEAMKTAIVYCSNLYHIADNEFVTASLREYLNCTECPEYPYIIPE